VIYFIACPGANAVKIGTTTNRVYERLNQAQVNCPLELELLAAHDGGYVEEAALHLRFADQRIRGEWFRLSEELTTHIQQLPKPQKPPRGWHGQKRNRSDPRPRHLSADRARAGVRQEPRHRPALFNQGD
jgi:hypothetical protein